MERQFELENLRRSIAMLRVGAPALDREAAMKLVRELQALESQIRRLRDGINAYLTMLGLNEESSMDRWLCCPRD